MRDESLTFTMMQPGEARTIEFPLHPHTVNARQVGALMEVLLETITSSLDQQADVSDGDLLQALCMVLAIRMNMVKAPAGAVRELVARVLEQADEAVDGARVVAAGKA